ncbi:hypothetical protein BS78_04G219200 [Paspalum vaginatum]|nr:hypothetical protein BS78_04G219200 [Paspalum vaginatum]
MPEPYGHCLGDLGLGQRQLLKGWADDLWLVGDRPGPRARSAAAAMAAAAPPPEPHQTLALPDALLLRVLACLPEPHLTGAASLVCRRWTRLAGRLRRRLAVRDWAFVAHRLPYRFPDLADLDLFPASIAAPTAAAASPLLTCAAVSLTLDTSADPPLGACRFVDDDALDRGLAAVAASFPNLRRLSATAAAESGGLMAIAGGCPTLQELELHRCTDLALRPVSAFAHLQILRIVAASPALYGAAQGGGVTDIGLTILAHGCKRLVKLELLGCEGSYDGIAAVGRCCAMLEELTISDHRMDGGWLAALAFCGNLKTLRMQGCSRIDDDPGPAEHLGACLTLESLQLHQCQLRDRRALHALFLVCEGAREIQVQNCWGLGDDMFALAGLCRRVKFLSLEGCSLLTTQGLESVITSWSDLQSLEVVSCNKIKDEEITPALSELFSNLKELKWRPDNKSLLAASLVGTGMGKKGRVFFKRERSEKQSKEAKKMAAAAAVPDGVSSCGSTNVRRADHLPPLPIPLPCIGEPTAASRVSPGSSPARSEASRGAPCYAADAEPDPEPEVEASVGRSTQMLLAMAAMGGRGGQYGRRPASSYGSCAAWSAGSLTKHRPASPSPICSPVSSHGGDGDGREPHGGGDASSFVTPRMEEEQGGLATRADFMKPSATPRNIRLQTPRRVEGANQVPHRFIHKATPARLMSRARSRNFRQRVGAIDAINEWRLPKVSEGDDEGGDQKDWQADTVSSRISSARDWNFESDGAFEGSNHSDRAFGDSDGENCPVPVQRTERWLPHSVLKPQGNFVHAKLVAWKDAQVAKLIEKLKRKESDIDDWQRNKIAKARQNMRNTELKLEKKRAEAGEKMQKAIKHTQRKADKKKVKEQAATAKQIAGVERALVKMSRTGKLPWSLAFL